MRKSIKASLHIYKLPVDPAAFFCGKFFQSPAAPEGSRGSDNRQQSSFGAPPDRLDVANGHPGERPTGSRAYS